MVKRTKLGRAEVARRLIAIALKHVKEPEDLIRLRMLLDPLFFHVKHCAGGTY